MLYLDFNSKCHSIDGFYCYVEGSETNFKERVGRYLKFIKSTDTLKTLFDEPSTGFSSSEENSFFKERNYLLEEFMEELLWVKKTCGTISSPLLDVKISTYREKVNKSNSSILNPLGLGDFLESVASFRLDAEFARMLKFYREEYPTYSTTEHGQTGKLYIQLLSAGFNWGMGVPGMTGYLSSSALKTRFLSEWSMNTHALEHGQGQERLDSNIDYLRMRGFSEVADFLEKDPIVRLDLLKVKKVCDKYNIKLMPLNADETKLVFPKYMQKESF